MPQASSEAPETRWYRSRDHRVGTQSRGSELLARSSPSRVRGFGRHRQTQRRTRGRCHSPGRARSTAPRWFAASSPDSSKQASRLVGHLVSHHEIGRPGELVGERPDGDKRAPNHVPPEYRQRSNALAEVRQGRSKRTDAASAYGPNLLILLSLLGGDGENRTHE